MDPETAYKTMSNTKLTYTERGDAAAALVGWLTIGGLLPTKYADRNPDNDPNIEKVHRLNIKAQCADVLTQAWNAR